MRRQLVVATTGGAVCCGHLRLAAENSSKNPRFCKSFGDNGLIRKPPLYPAELRAQLLSSQTLMALHPSDPLRTTTTVTTTGWRSQIAGCIPKNRVPCQLSRVRPAVFQTAAWRPRLPRRRRSSNDSRLTLLATIRTRGEARSFPLSTHPRREPRPRTFARELYLHYGAVTRGTLRQPLERANLFCRTPSVAIGSSPREAARSQGPDGDGRA